MRRALVFGGNGFLGRHVVSALRDEGWKADCAPPREALDLRCAHPASIAALLDAHRPDVVVNAAGTVTGPAQAIACGNVDTVTRLIAGCRVAAPGIRFIHLGSMAEYGYGEGRPIHEDDVASPATDYGRAKLEATRRVLAASPGLVDGVVLRVANPLGRGQAESTLAGSVLAQMRRGAAAPVTVGPLQGARDFVSARDVGRAVAAAAGAAPEVFAAHRILNIGSGIATALVQLVHALLMSGGHRGEFHIAPGAAASPTSGGGLVLVPDVSRAEALLAWQAQDDLRVGVESVLGELSTMVASR